MRPPTGPDHLIGLEFRQLAAFHAVAEERSFSRAARRLGYSQSAISQQVAALEAVVGHRLLERRGGQRPASLTPVGEIVLRHAEALLSRVRATATDIAALAGGLSGELRIGAYQRVSTRIVPEVLRTFALDWPETTVRLVEVPDDRAVLARLEAGSLDLAFVALPTPEGPFETVELLREPYVLLVAACSPLAAATRRPPLTEIARLPMIGHTETLCQQRLEETLRAAGIEPRIVFRTDDNSTVQALVGAGFGCALLPLLAVDPRDERTTVVELAERLPPLVLGVARHRDRHSPAACAFVESTVAVARSLELRRAS
jgi:DNA-binding transcriptional LysR family regulator